MSSPLFKHQFKHSDYERRTSIVYGSLGKGGLFVPQDFVDSKSALDDEDEETALLPQHNKRSQSIIERDILNKERELLQDHNILIGSSSTSSEQPSDPEEVRKVFEEAVVNKKIPVNSTFVELKHLVKSSVPLVLTFLLQNSLSTVSVLSVGHLGAAYLAAVSMGAMTANITGYAIIQGIATALDTLCPQAFGAKKYLLVGVYFQKCTALIFTVMIPMMLIWLFFSYELILFLVPDAHTAKLAAVYLKCIIPGIPAYVFFETGKRFLQAQGVYHISTYVLFVAAPLNVVMNFGLVSRIGYIGAPIAVAINYWIMAAGLYVGTVYYVKPEQTTSGLHPLICWGGLDIPQAFKNWGKLIGLAIPGFLMLEAEFFAFEILTLIASYLGTVALAAQSVGSTVASLTYQVPFAIGIAASTRIANYLGAGLPENAKKSTQIALGFGLGVSLFNFIIIFSFQNVIVQLFTDDQDVIDTIKSVMWLVALMQVSDAVNANSAGCLRGQGQTKIGGIVNLFSYYVVGLPLSIYLTFYSPWKGTLHGLWIGTVVALSIIGLVQSFYSLFADFDKLCDDARNRTNVDISV